MPKTRALDVVGVSRVAKELIVDLTDQPFDAIASCQAVEGGWRLEIEVIESKARLGDDDLLSTYELTLSAEGALMAYRRLRRRRRFDDAPIEAA